MSLHSIYSLALLFLALSGTYCQQIDLEEIGNNLKNELGGLDLGGLNITKDDLPKQEDLEKVLREKCVQNGGGEEAFNALKNQKAEIQSCIEQYINTTVIEQEVEKAKETGSMDDVFGKYCKKYPDIHKCIDAATEKVRPCLSADENVALNKSLKIADELQEFVCFKDGDRIAMFIAEGGMECLESKKEELQACANETIGSRIPTEFSVNNLPSFLFSNQDCSDFDKIRTCFNTELEKCKDSTPANIIDAFFKFLKKHMPCNTTPEIVSEKTLTRASHDSGATSLSYPVLIPLMSFFVFKYLF